LAARPDPQKLHLVNSLSHPISPFMEPARQLGDKHLLIEPMLREGRNQS
jgi:hypothetical protein